ncbi:MAG: hypothetical protein WDA20_12145 [Desulfuromonadales bacterium]
MEVDLKLLRYLTGKGVHHIEEAVEGTGYLPRTVVGVGTYLLDIDGDVDLLTGKQQVTFEKFLRPLLFDVACQGLSGPETCRGDGKIEAELLAKCYRDGEFRCRKCREA